MSEIEAENEEIMTFSANSEMASVNVSAPVQAITSLGKSVLTGASLSKQRFKTLLWVNKNSLSMLRILLEKEKV